MNDRIRFDFGLWRNDKREKPTQPQLKSGKPVEIDGKRYWASAFVKDGKDEAMAVRIDNFIDVVADNNGSIPIISVSLELLDDQQAPPAKSKPAVSDDDCPF